MASRRGSRYFDGRQLLLAERECGLHARTKIEAEAKRRRDLGRWVRVVKVYAFATTVGEVGDFLLYELQGEPGERGRRE